MRGKGAEHGGGDEVRVLDITDGALLDDGGASSSHHINDSNGAETKLQK